MSRNKTWALVGLLMGLSGACLASGEGGASTMEESTLAASLYFPPADGSWETVPPQALGWDMVALDRVFEFAEAHNSSGLIILHDGRILAERQWKLEGNPPVAGKVGYEETWHHGNTDDGWAREDVASAQKSVISILAGIAWDKGLLDLDAPVSRYLGKGWSRATPEQEAAITVRNLMQMSSGLTETLEFSFPAGSDWAYINKAYSLVNEVIQAATGREPNDFTREWLTGPLGMKNTEWITRSEFFRKWNMNGLVTTAPDLARFGLMIQAGGTWNGQRIVSEAYLKQALATPDAHNPAYGLLWWLNSPQGHRAVRDKAILPGSLLPAAPADLVTAAGNSDRSCAVVPSMGLVVVRTGSTWKLNDDGSQISGFGFEQRLWELIMEAAPKGRASVPESTHAAGSDPGLLLAVQDLMYQYAEKADNFDAEGWTALFLPDAVLEAYDGPDGMLSKRVASNAERLQEMQKRNELFREHKMRSRHLISNFRITGRSGDLVMARCLFYVAWQFPEEKTPRLVHTGEYRIVVKQTDKGWRFVSRQAFIDHGSSASQ